MCPSEPPPADVVGAGGVLTIDLDAIAANWRRLNGLLGKSGAACGAVVKANAYGLGMARVARALWQAGCRTFFVALAAEGVVLRDCLPDAEICVFNGCDGAEAGALTHSALVPVLNHPGQIAAWAAAARTADRVLPAFLHVDTGMNRLGLSAADVAALAGDPGRLAGIEVTGVMSHLACADDPGHALNAAQRTRFMTAVEKLGRLGGHRASLANSSAIFLGPDYHFALARPGAALYGVDPRRTGPNPMDQVVELKAKILQTRRIDTPSTVGYGATHQAERGRLIATLAVGYADGYLRSLSGAGGVHLGGHRAPVVGRVSMDLITIDVTDVPEHLAQPGLWAELIGPHHPVDELGREAGTIAYEILTALGSRYVRRYTGGTSS